MRDSAGTPWSHFPSSICKTLIILNIFTGFQACYMWFTCVNDNNKQSKALNRTCCILSGTKSLLYSGQKCFQFVHLSLFWFRPPPLSPVCLILCVSPQEIHSFMCQMVRVGKPRWIITIWTDELINCLLIYSNYILTPPCMFPPTVF